MHACTTLLYIILFACFVLHIIYIYIYICNIAFPLFPYKFQIDIYRIMHTLCIYTYNPIIQILQLNVTVEYFRSICLHSFFLSIG